MTREYRPGLATPTLKPFDYLQQRSDGAFEKAPEGTKTRFVVAPLPANTGLDLADRLERLAAEVGIERARHIEMMAAAYFATTDVSPRDAVLIEQRTAEGCRWWFERKPQISSPPPQSPPESAGSTHRS